MVGEGIEPLMTLNSQRRREREMEKRRTKQLAKMTLPRQNTIEIETETNIIVKQNMRRIRGD